MTHSSSFRNLKAWRDAMTLVEDVYRLSARFPTTERFGLTSRLGFAPSLEVEPVMKRTAEVGRMLNGLIEALQVGQRARL